VGGARTALFNWLFARREGGTFVLRIEDTDRERSRPEMTDAILDGMSWLGLAWDEGPLHQADGLERHVSDVRRLLDGGAAYRCFCTPQALDARRSRAAVPEGWRYDRHCLTHVAAEDSDARAAAGEPFAVRFRVPPGTTAWDDAVHGTISFDNDSIDDFIILRTDGTPIYNMAVVSDDVAMKITHVIRGDDHVSNTPKQILLYRGLGAELPVFGHVPMILGPDGKRLSKRHGATAIGEYRHQGILPEAMVNFLALLGWSPGTDEEVFTVDELVARFSLDGINSKSAVFDAQKLLWMNGQHLNRMPGAELEGLVRERLQADGVDTAHIPSDRVGRIIDLLKVRARSIQDIARHARPYVANAVEYAPDAVQKHWREPAVADRLEALDSAFAAQDDWSIAPIEAALRELAGQLGIAPGKLIHPLRVALTGETVGPGIFEVAAVLGKEHVHERLRTAVDFLRRESVGRSTA
jgi:glutamyl-tRNA synthetase